MSSPLAGGARPAGPRLGVLVELRLRLFLARLRGRGGIAEGVARAVGLFVAGPAALAFAVALGAASYRLALRAPGWDPLAVSVSAGAMLFAVWNGWTLLGLAMGERDALGLSRMLLYPVAPGRLYALGLAASLLGDPVAIVGALSLLGALTGAGVARPGAWLFGLAALLAGFAVATVTLVALLQEVLARLAASRWRILLALAVVGGLGLLRAAASGREGGFEALLPVLRRARWLAYPAALAGEGAARLYRGEGAGAALLPAGLLLLSSAAAGALAYRLALGAARSGGDGGPSAVGGWAPSTPGERSSRAPRLSRWLGPLLELELRVLVRNPAARLSCVMVPAFVALFGGGLLRGTLPAGGAAASPVSRAVPLFVAVVYAQLSLQAFWLNPFGYDRGGARALFLAPVSPERILMAKNGAHLLLGLVVGALSIGAYAVVTGTPSVWALLSSAALALGLAPALLVTGNVVGTLAPRAVPAGIQRGAAVSPLAGLAGMAALSGAGLAFALPALAAVGWERPALVPLAWAGLAAAGWAGWFAALPAMGRLLQRRREALLEVVCGDEV